MKMKGVPKLIKVGRTSGPLEKRRRELNTGNPYRLKIVAAWKVKNSNLGEKAAHKFLDDDQHVNYVRAQPQPKYGGGREWFIIQDNNLDNVYYGIEDALKAKKQFVKTAIRWL